MTKIQEKIEFIVFDTVLGSSALVFGKSGLMRVELPSVNLEKRLANKYEKTSFSKAPVWIKKTAKKIQKHFLSGGENFRDVLLNLEGIAPFYKKVYQMCRKIAPGKLKTYGELAALCGKPGAARAVGQAMAKNPLPIIVPCHRVVACNGGLGGFSAQGGIKTKRRLLELEGVKF